MFWRKKDRPEVEGDQPKLMVEPGKVVKRDAPPETTAVPFSQFVQNAEQMEEELEWRYPNGYQAFIEDLKASPIRTIKTALTVLGEAGDERVTLALFDSYWAKIPFKAQLELAKYLFVSGKGQQPKLRDVKDPPKDEEM